jgi:hypothetical protein
MAGMQERLAWRRWLGEAIGKVRDNWRGLLALAWPWYGAAAVVLAQAWLLFGVSPFGPREIGHFWWPALLQEVLIGLSGAAIAVRMTRHVALGEPLVVPLRQYGRLVVRYALRFVAALVATAAVTAGAALIIGGIAGIKALLLPMGLLFILKQIVVVTLILLVFALASGRLHFWLTAAALERDDLDLPTSLRASRRGNLPLIAGMLLLYLPPLAFDLAMLRLVPADAGLALTLPVFLTETAVSLMFSAALAAYLARLVPTLVPAEVAAATPSAQGVAATDSAAA